MRYDHAIDDRVVRTNEGEATSLSSRVLSHVGAGQKMLLPMGVLSSV
jgi:hypothetical protein